MAANLTVAYAVLGVYLLVILGAGVLGAFLNWHWQRKGQGQKEHNLVRAACCPAPDLRCSELHCLRPGLGD